MLEDFFGKCSVVTQNFGTLQEKKKKSVLWNFNSTETCLGLCLMANPGFILTASGVRFCSALDITETHFHLGQTAEEEQSSGCHLDFLSKPDCNTESILHSPQRWQHLSWAPSPAPQARRWAAGDTLGCPWGAWHHHPMLPSIPLPALLPLSVTRTTPGWDGSSKRACASTRLPLTDMMQWWVMENTPGKWQTCWVLFADRPKSFLCSSNNVKILNAQLYGNQN